MADKTVAEKATQHCSHTPGPWEINEGDGMAIAKVSMFAITAPCTADIGDLSRDEKFANARLIAAAPELLAALKSAINAIRTLHGINLPPHAEAAMWELYQQSPEMRAINAVIAKAEGRS